MAASVQKIRDRQLASPGSSETLQDLVVNEQKEKKVNASGGLLWLNRSVLKAQATPNEPMRLTPFPYSGLDFTAQALRLNLQNPSQELSDSFRGAYGNTLKPHHNFLIKPVFSAAMSATPYRKDFYAKLGDDQKKVEAELDAWLKALEKVVGILNDYNRKMNVKG